jgi:hypothetical protein
MKQYSYSKDEVRTILEAIINPGSNSSESNQPRRSNTPKKERKAAEDRELPLAFSTKDAFKLIDFNMLIAPDTNLGRVSKSSRQGLIVAGENSDESVLLKRNDNILSDMNSSKGHLIGKSSKDSRDFAPDESGSGVHMGEEDLGMVPEDTQEQNVASLNVDLDELFSDQPVPQIKVVRKVKDLLGKDEETTKKMEVVQEQDID